MPLSVVVGSLAATHVPSAGPPGEVFSSRAPGPAFVAVVDDDHHHRIPLLRALRGAGHAVLHAGSPRSFERLLEDSAHEIAALVCCAEMKEMSGFELARRVIQRRADIRVLLVFKDGADQRERARASALGYAHVVRSAAPGDVCFQLARLLGAFDPGDRLYA